jgi:ankyrin repeat protein
MSELTLCVIRQDVQGLISLLESGNVDPNSYSDQGYTPLEMASHLAFGVDKRMAEILIKWGADVNMPGKNGTTPLYAAVSRCDPSCIRLLLKKGANPLVPSRRGVSPFQLAYQKLEKARAEGYEPLVKEREEVVRLLEGELHRRARVAGVAMRLVCRAQDIPYDIIEHVVRFV